MKSYKELGIEAKNKRRAKPSGKIHKKKAKKTKTIRIQRRFVGPDHSAHCMFGSDYYSREWQNVYGKYAKIQDAEQAAKNLNYKESFFEYRVLPNDKNTKDSSGTP